MHHPRARILYKWEDINILRVNQDIAFVKNDPERHFQPVVYAVSRFLTRVHLARGLQTRAAHRRLEIQVTT